MIRLLSVLLLLFSACHRAPTTQERQFADSFPTKDELVTVDGRPLSLAGFFILKSKLKTTSIDAIAWAGIAVLAIEDKVSPNSGLILTQYAIGELKIASAEAALREYYGALSTFPDAAQVKKDLDLAITRSVVHRNERVFASLSHP